MRRYQSELVVASDDLGQCACAVNPVLTMICRLVLGAPGSGEVADLVVFSKGVDQDKRMLKPAGRQLSRANPPRRQMIGYRP